MRKSVGLTMLLGAFLMSCGGGFAEPPQILRDSWTAYVGRFIQEDGRVIDRRAGAISTSEGQAYAMLRAVWIGDRTIFDKAYAWGRNNLNSGVRRDRLWAWKWGKSEQGSWQVLDPAFASDADQDVALALILASRVWQHEPYLLEARAILADLWTLGTRIADGKRFMLAGDRLCSGDTCRVNPSYAAPYAYRIFAGADSAHDWLSLVESSYFLLDAASRLTQTRLPPDWMLLNARTGELRLSNEKDSAFSYDAFRTYWRVAMDRSLFSEPRADRYLKETLPWLIAEWKRNRTLPAIISSTGRAAASFESLEMISALIPAVQLIDSSSAKAMEQKLQSQYRNGFWGDRDSYYLQNWAWFGTALFHQYLDPLITLRRNAG